MIRDDLKNFEATRWVVDKFKHHWLRRLFKPVTSTTYNSLIKQFYEHLTFDCNKPGVMSSSIMGVDIEVTSTNIVAAIKCNNEYLCNARTVLILVLSPKKASNHLERAYSI